MRRPPSPSAPPASLLTTISAPLDRLADTPRRALAATRHFGESCPLPNPIMVDRYRVLARGDVAIVAVEERLGAERVEHLFRLDGAGGVESSLPSP